VKGLLVLEDGTVCSGLAIGRPGTSFGELVFNTAMSGYQEVLTDPSYAGQIVIMTAAHIGNYGVRDVEAESDRVHVAGFVARDFPERWSGTWGQESLGEYLGRSGVIGLHGLDTRALVRRLRTQGAMRAGLSTEITDPAELLRRVRESPEMVGSDLALKVSPTQVSVHPGEKDRFRVAAMDLGMKRNIVRLLNRAGCQVTVFPATASAAAMNEGSPDGFFLSNGPGDPAALGGPIAFVTDGDTISIDVDRHAVDLEVGPEELERRRAAWQPPAPRYTAGVFAKYAALVSSASEGAVTDPGPRRRVSQAGSPAIS